MNSYINKTEALRAMIRKHKRWDMIFGMVGLTMMMSASWPWRHFFRDGY